MKVSEAIKKLNFYIAAPGGDLETEITGGYAGDLLSNVMGQGEPGQIWVTMQGHHNIVAIASLIGLSAVVVAGGAAVEKDTLLKASQHQVTILTTQMPAFEAIGKLYQLGIGKA